MRRRVAIVWLMLLVLGGCSDDGSDDGVAVDELETTTSRAPGGPPTTDPSIRIVLGAGRLSVGGNALVFDAPASQVSSYLERALGEPEDDSEQDCGPGRLQILTWPSLEVFLLDGRLVGWNVDDDTYATDLGVAIGSSRAEVLTAYPTATFPASTLGEEFFVEVTTPEPATLSGLLEGDVVAALWSGATCLAR
jgi:hypothetical protein